MTIYLYVKTHNLTGLKYLGKTIAKDPHKYKGSGLRWQRHLKKHGNDVSTIILLMTESEEELKRTGLFFSNLWNVANSPLWANCKPESGDGGSTSEMYTDEMKRKMSQNRKGKVGRKTGWKHTDETKSKMSSSAKERCDRIGPPKTAFIKGCVSPNLGIKMSDEQKEKLSKSAKASTAQCNYCGKISTKGNISRWHQENCKKRL